MKAPGLLVGILLVMGSDAFLVTTNEMICKEIPADIALILDESRSIYPVHFKLLMNYMAKLSERFTINPELTRFSALMFGEGVEDKFDFDTFITNDEVSMELKSLKQNLENGDTTNTHLGLKRFREHYYPQMRENVAKFAILVTDGNSRFKERTLQEGQLLKDLNVTVLVIGISNKVDDRENEQLVTSPADSHYFKIDSFNQLSDLLINQVVKTACKQTEPVKVCMADVVITLASISKNPGGAYSAFNLVKAVSNWADYSNLKLDMRYGMVPSACQLDVGFNLDFQENGLIEEHLYDKEQTRMNEANHISAMREMFIKFGRPKVNKFGIIILDSPVKGNSDQITQASRLAKSAGIELIAIGVGKIDYGSVLDDLSSSAIQSPYIFTLSDYSQPEIQNVRGRIQSILCQ